MPEDLALILKTQTKKISLKTKDEADAKRRLWPVIAEWQREFDDVRARRALTHSDREHAVWDHYTDVLERDEAERAALPGEAEIEVAKADVRGRVDRGEIKGIDALSILDATLDLMVVQRAGKISAHARKVKLSEMRKHLAKGETVLIADAVDEYLRQNRLFVERSTPDWISLARRMMRAEIDALSRSLERDRGDFTGQPRDPLIKPPTLDRRAQAGVAAPGESIMEAVEAFRKENPRNDSKSRMDESFRDIGIFIQTVGLGFPLAQITKKHVREWKVLLMKYPVRATEVVAFRGMNIKQTVGGERGVESPGPIGPDSEPLPIKPFGLLLLGRGQWLHRYQPLFRYGPAQRTPRKNVDLYC